jgi:hypothetical protein
MMDKWINPGKYVGGAELAAAGLAELITFENLRELGLPTPSTNGKAHSGGRVKQRS